MQSKSDTSENSTNFSFDFDSAKVLVVGDTKLDTYWFATTNRTSPEAPVPIARYQDSDHRLAGAAQIAAVMKNLALRSTQIDLMTEVGLDNELDQNSGQTNSELNSTLTQLLDDHKIPTNNIFKTADKTKQSIRIVSQSQQLLRIDSEQDTSTLDHSQSSQAELQQKFYEIFCNYQTIVFYDQHLNSKLLKRWLQECTNNNIRSIYFTDNLEKIHCFIEEKLVVDCIILKQEDLSKITDKSVLKNLYTSSSVLIIDEANGLKFYNAVTKHQDYIQPINTEVENTIGVTEAVIGVFALTLTATNDIKYSATLASAAIGFTVRQFGQCVISLVDLQLAYADYLLNSKYNFLNLKQEILAAKAKGQKIVFANGCFDVLHAGHVAYLDLARQRGDKLFVAINGDCSIRRLKGTNRPINNLADRLYVLSALECVSWIVPFFSDTPEDFLRWLQPDLLVKGGDYREDQIVGREIVYSYGGKTEIIAHPYNQISSTKIIEAL